MCLSLEPGVKPEDAIKTAKEDITCYKILKSYWHRSVDDKEILKSLYQDFDYVMGRKYQRKPELGLGFILCPGYPEYNTLDRYEVHEAFHSYKYEENALSELDEFGRRNHFRVVAVKCTIPKGSKYVETDAFYASDTIILNEIIGEYKNKMKIII